VLNGTDGSGSETKKTAREVTAWVGSRASRRLQPFEQNAKSACQESADLDFR